jgi:hypothetical protein
VPRKLTLKAVEAQIRKLEAQAKKLKEAEKAGMAELKAVIAKFKLAPQRNLGRARPQAEMAEQLDCQGQEARRLRCLASTQQSVRILYPFVQRLRRAADLAWLLRRSPPTVTDALCS